MIHHYFVILEVSSPILKGAYMDIFVTKDFYDFCAIHDNHENI